jgi:Predicted membrane protein
MRHRIFYNPFTFVFTLILTFVLAFSISVLFFGFVSSAFAKIGFSWNDALILLLASLIGSSINIPLKTIESETPIENQKYVKVFGVSYRIPFKQTYKTRTTIAINVGGALIPTIVSLYLLSLFPDAAIYAIYATAFVALITKSVARPVKGVGIVSPALLPPIAAALSSVIIVYTTHVQHELIFAIAYTSGTLGTLIGADLLNMRAITKLGAPVVSIGGAGTFDGVFLAGVIAVLLV